MKIQDGVRPPSCLIFTISQYCDCRYQSPYQIISSRYLNK